jgi:hypothetical protein
MCNGAFSLRVLINEFVEPFASNNVHRKKVQILQAYTARVSYVGLRDSNILWLWPPLLEMLNITRCPLVPLP